MQLDNTLENDLLREDTTIAYDTNHEAVLRPSRKMEIVAMEGVSQLQAYSGLECKTPGLEDPAIRQKVSERHHTCGR